MNKSGIHTIRWNMSWLEFNFLFLFITHCLSLIRRTAAENYSSSFVVNALAIVETTRLLPSLSLLRQVNSRIQGNYHRHPNLYYR